MSDEKQIEIIKRGETSLTMSLNRGPSGLVIAVKVHPVVEAFIRGLGDGGSSDVKASGPYWRPVGSGGPILIHNLALDAPGQIQLESGEYAYINKPGQPILDPHGAVDINTGKHRPGINLSFLRIAGVSEGAGVTFSVRGVHSYEALTKMREKIGEAYRGLYRAYMKPIQMDIVVSTQETSL